MNAIDTREITATAVAWEAAIDQLFGEINRIYGVGRYPEWVEDEWDLLVLIREHISPEMGATTEHAIKIPIRLMGLLRLPEAAVPTG